MNYKESTHEIHIGSSPFDGAVIEHSRGWTSIGIRDIWEYRELLAFLIVRETQGIYRQTALGMSWIFLRPVLNMLLLSFVFGAIVKIPTGGVPYPLFSLAALLPWGYFSNSVTRSSRSLVDNLHVISKVYFPRMVIPISATLSGLVDFSASFVVFLVALLIYRMPFRPEMLWMPVFLGVCIVFALTTGLWLATLSVKFRDVSFAILFLLQALMYLSPVIYPISMVPERLQFVYKLNPMTGVIQGFRWSFLGYGEPPGIEFVLSIGLLLIGLVIGAFIFRRTERTIVDYL